MTAISSRSLHTVNMKHSANRKAQIPRARLGSLVTGPAQFRANPEVSRKYRFVSTSGTPTVIRVNTLIASCGVLATTATTGSSVFQSVKLRSVEIWSPPASQGAASTCSVLWPLSNESQPREISDTTVSTAVPAHVSCGPPSHSLASFWNTATSGSALMTLTAPPGSIIDVAVSIVMGDGVTASASAVLVGATPGSVYFCALDSSTAAGSIYTPVSLTQL